MIDDKEIRIALSNRFYSDELRRIFVDDDKKQTLFIFTIIDNFLKAQTSNDELKTRFVDTMRQCLDNK